MTIEGEKECAAQPKTPASATATGSRLGPARLGLNGWHGTSWDTVIVIGETAKRYRITSAKRIVLPGYRLLEPFGVVLVPKTAVRFRDES